MAGSVCTLSYWVYTGDGRSVTVTIAYANSVDNFASKTTISSTTHATTAGNYTKHTFSFTAPTGFSHHGIEVRFSFGALGSGIQVALAQVQLERSSVVTDFEYRSTGLELSLCKRYFQRLPSNYFMYNSQVVSAATYYGIAAFPEMRAAPVVSNVTTAGNAGFGATAGLIMGSSSIRFYSTASATSNGLFYGGGDLSAEL